MAAAQINQKMIFAAALNPGMSARDMSLADDDVLVRAAAYDDQGL
jgi:hypothetical protein